MENSFFNFVKEQIKGIPCSASLDVEPLKIEEDQFLKLIDENYDSYLLFFKKYSIFGGVEDKDIEYDTYIEVEENISYYLKLNNQIFLEYKTYNNNKNFMSGIDVYTVSLINVYTSNTHNIELIKILSLISDYIKKIKNKN
ncbi:MAG: hypothetical protein ACOC3V_01430 [bacterium]